MIVEKEEYAKEGVHMGMDGWICNERRIDGYWFVCFDQDSPLLNVADIGVREEDFEIMIEV